MKFTQSNYSLLLLNKNIQYNLTVSKSTLKMEVADSSNYMASNPED